MTPRTGAEHRIPDRPSNPFVDAHHRKAVSYNKKYTCSAQKIAIKEENISLDAAVATRRRFPGGFVQDSVDFGLQGFRVVDGDGAVVQRSHQAVKCTV